MKAQELITKFLGMTGVAPAGAEALSVFLAEEMETARKKADRLLLLEGWVLEAIPCTIEPPDIEPEEPWLTSIPVTVALHFSGLLVNGLVGEGPGGMLEERTYVVDTNAAARTGTLPLYVAECVDDGLQAASLLPSRYLDDARERDAMAGAWGKVSDLIDSKRSPAIQAKRKELATAFVAKYPGVAHHGRSLLISHGIDEAVLDAAPEPAVMPEALAAVYDAFLLIAPSLLAAKGLPPAGADTKAAKAAATRLAKVSAFGDYEAPHLLAELFILWLGGDEAGAKKKAESIVSGGLGIPLTRRWASRMLGKEPTE